MKLAEALQLRADLQKRLAQLHDRLCENAMVQEGEKPAEDPVALLAEFEDCAAQLEDLMARINRTNSETHTEYGTLTELLARRDCLKLRWRTYHQFLTDGDPGSQRCAGAGVPEEGGCHLSPAAGGGQHHPVRQLDHRIAIKTIW